MNVKTKDTPPTLLPAADGAAGPVEPSGWRCIASRPRLRWTAGLGALSLVLFLTLRTSPLEVEVGRIERGPLETTVDAEATTRVLDRYLLAAPVAGHLDRIVLREGDVVEAGMIVARLSPLPLDPQAAALARARMAGAQAALQEAGVREAQARELLDQAERSTGRIRAVAETAGISVEDVEQAGLRQAAATLELQAAGARVAAARAEVEAARASLMALETGSGAVAVVRSPVGGRLLRLHEQSERVLPAGAPIALVGDPGRLEVVVPVLSTDAVRIQPGAPIRFNEWGDDRELAGRVSRVEPAGFTRVSALGVEEQRVNVIGELIDPPAGLGDGFRLQAGIVIWAAADVLVVPVAAIFRDGDAWAAFIVENGRAMRRSLRLGNRGASAAEVLEGLRPGDEVILFPSNDIRDGIRVRAAGG